MKTILMMVILLQVMLLLDGIYEFLILRRRLKRLQIRQEHLLERCMQYKKELAHTAAEADKLRADSIRRKAALEQAEKTIDAQKKRFAAEMDAKEEKHRAEAVRRDEKWESIVQSLQRQLERRAGQEERQAG